MSFTIASTPMLQTTTNNIRVIDSDGITAIVVCRLDGIDCPEYGQPYAGEASSLLEELCLDTPLVLTFVGVDKYNRLLTRVVNAKNENICAELVKAGLAWAMPGYAEYRKFELEARRKKINIWSDPNPVAPWKYREDHERKRRGTG